MIVSVQILAVWWFLSCLQGCSYRCLLSESTLSKLQPLESWQSALRALKKRQKIEALDSVCAHIYHWEAIVTLKRDWWTYHLWKHLVIKYQGGHNTWSWMKPTVRAVTLKHRSYRYCLTLCGNVCEGNKRVLSEQLQRFAFIVIIVSLSPQPHW